MPYPFQIVDVFTDTAFGGNQLAVLTAADGLDTGQMQSIAIEFGFAESTFVLPPIDDSNDARVRIFTPGSEVPFAGHPNIGTAFVIAAALGPLANSNERVLSFEELAGLVCVRVAYNEQGIPQFAELTAPQDLNVGATLAPADVASAIGVSIGDIFTGNHPPVEASVGLGFVFVELASAAALAKAATDSARMSTLLAGSDAIGMHIYTSDTQLSDVELRARMFAPSQGVIEDAATGSANCALAGLLASIDGRSDGDRTWHIAQGVEMGRPSRIVATASKSGGNVTAVKVGGACVFVARGELSVPT
ncbi:MAG: PhzF family phenazine biosynthesis protein [Chromatiales bacterium]|jgi:trans-2,3-dihydro-3-hydroxyanthranilate isomerase|nr:PhzF family phenazine biosynthesis protein [Chromatiales bacterium]